MLTNWYSLFWCTLVLLAPPGNNAASILSLFPHSSESHFSLMRSFVKELVRNGHNVTLYTGHGLDEPMEGLIEYKVEPVQDFWQDVRSNTARLTTSEDFASLNEVQLESALANSGYNLVANFLSNIAVQQLLSMPKDNSPFNIIVVDMFYTDALLFVCHYFKRPCIGVVSSDFANYMGSTMDMMVPGACLPYNPHQTTKPDFWERLQHTQSCMNRRKRILDGHYTLQQDLVAKLLTGQSKEWEPTPSIQTLHASLALVLINNYLPLQLPRPLSMNMILVGGMQAGRPQELPWYIKRFLDEARRGVVYINLGDHHRCATIDRAAVRILTDVIASLQQRLVWTCHQDKDESFFDSSHEDFMVQHLVPQTDILAHPHVKLFITNGDLLSIQDGIVHHVPILGVPLFDNEVRNMELVERFQIGVRLDYKNLTETSLRWALETILNNEYYVLNVRALAKVYRDRPLGGLAQAVFWLEYVLNYGGIHLSLPESPVGLQQLHLQDLQIYRLLCALLATILMVAIGSVLWWCLKIRQPRKNAAKLS